MNKYDDYISNNLEENILGGDTPVIRSYHLTVPPTARPGT